MSGLPDTEAGPGRGFVRRRDHHAGMPEVAAAISGYRRRTFVLKALLPTIALGTLVTVALWSSLSGTVPGFRLEALQQTYGDGGDDRMTSPRFYGVDSNNRPFTITADEAVRDPTDEKLVRLTQIKADIGAADDDWTYLSADNGVYDRGAEMLDLAGAVTLFTGDGMEVETEAAQLDLVAGSAKGDAALHGQGPWGMLDAVGFTYQREGSIFHFFGTPKLVLYPQSGED